VDQARRLGVTLVLQAHPLLYLETLSGALTATGHVVRGATPDPGAVPGLVSALAPELCLLHDVEPASCLAAARAVRDRAPAVKLVVISAGKAPQTQRAYDEHIVDAVVGQACDFTVLGAVLRRVARGERHLADGARPATPGRPPPTLTPRERQVLEHLVHGATTESIAHELAISPNTVRSHVQGLARKLGTHGRGAAVKAALSRSLLESRAT
jgi:DNA-binding NarL/FixJ family response regulator